MKPRIAFYGSSLVSAYWNGAATYYRGIISGLAARGFDITFYEPDAYQRQQHRDIADPDWATVVVYPSAAEAGESGVMAALAQARHADIVVKTSGVGVFDELLERELLRAKAPQALSIFWDVDAPATLERLALNADDPFHDLVGRYDLVLTYGGGQPVVDDYRRVGARECVPVYNALDPETHFPVAADARFAGSLGLLANRLPDRERRIEQFFLAAADHMPEHAFVLGGNGWADKPMPTNVRPVGHVYTRDHNAFNCSSLAVLNVNRDSMARYGFSPATRIFEAAGAGACLITDAWDGIETFLEPEQEILIARDGDEVAAHLRALDPQHARRIGEAAMRRVLAHHTYRHRAAQVEALLGAYLAV